MTQRQKTGQQGEQLAADHLHVRGYTIITRNWHCKYGEIDLVAKKGDTLIFVEVRTRHSATTETALGSITPKKQEKMVKSAYAYITENDYPEDADWRIDVIAIALSRSPIIDHVENALGW